LSNEHHNFLILTPCMTYDLYKNTSCVVISKSPRGENLVENILLFSMCLYTVNHRVYKLITVKGFLLIEIDVH